MSTSSAANFAGTTPNWTATYSRELPLAISAATGRLDVMGVGAMSYYQDTTGAGPAVVLLHSVNAAASSSEMRALFEALRGHRRVFALDLPGFGRSQRGDRPYSAAMYAEAIERFVVDVASPQGEPVDAVALSLSSEFLARAAGRSPGLFGSLTLLSPTGLGASQPGGGLAQGVVRRALQVGPVSDAMFRLLRTQPSIRYFLAKSFVGAVDEGLVRYSLQSAAVPGAKFAPLKFIAGELSTPDALRALYEPLTVPTRVVYDQDPYTSFDRLEALTRSNPRVSAHRVAPTLGMPQVERALEVAALIDGSAARAGAAT